MRIRINLEYILHSWYKMDSSPRLTYEEALYRGGKIAPNVVYEITLDTTRNDLISGSARIDFSLLEATESIWLDYIGEVTSLSINSKSVPICHLMNKLYLWPLPKGSFSLYIEFSSRYSQDGTGMHYFTDPYDGLVYKYAYLCPYYANRVFPCFDQPDIKGRFSFKISAIASNLVISNVNSR